MLKHKTMHNYAASVKCVQVHYVSKITIIKLITVKIQAVL
jgi:hypothetical protein